MSRSANHAEEKRDEQRLRYFEDLDLGLKLRSGAQGHLDRYAEGRAPAREIERVVPAEARAQGVPRAMEEKWRFSPGTHADDEPPLVRRLRRLVVVSLRLGVEVP